MLAGESETAREIVKKLHQCDILQLVAPPKSISFFRAQHFIIRDYIDAIFSYERVLQTMKPVGLVPLPFLGKDRELLITLNAHLRYVHRWLADGFIDAVSQYLWAESGSTR